MHSLLTRISLFLRGRPRESPAFTDLVREAWEWRANRQEALKRVFEIGTYERFDWYQEKGIIIFSSSGTAKVVANIQFAGSISNLTRSWLWAWRNGAFLEPVTRASQHVRHIGEREGYEKLTRPKWHANETDGWEMTSVQAMLTSAEGVYRTPSELGSAFMTLSNVRWASSDQWYERAETPN
jgi:hypothetical protein